MSICSWLPFTVKNRGSPNSFSPSSMPGPRSTVYEISHSYQPVDGLVETERLEASMELSSFEVNVTDNEVAASPILREF